MIKESRSAVLEKIDKSCKAETMYLDYVNNFITVGCFAEHYNLTESEAIAVITEGRKICYKFGH